MLVPDVYPNYLIDSRLRQMGFRNVRMLTPGVPEEVSTDLTVEVIPKMNAFGQERFRAAMLGCFVPVDPTTPPASYERGEARSCNRFRISGLLF